ncbi:hypothetical protein SAMN05421820_116123 [Pedobacter steynii]|uniref:Uncharacterized protein n=1 Tax=Pedobacter steynii TaxID=430522 RepID=A0A1H0KR06_9SPHI|nr:hypothetical protein [Pedobacter steynii]NQX43354.1 hypothetical protein [Pedobacter steynii]SDO58201.1 hypothetical protein SAMN05421820_116123 [Pedobacter steynii]
MKNRIILGLTAAVIAVFSFNSAKAETESAGGGSDGNCVAPFTNTCMVIHLPLGVTKTIKGVLTIKP